MIQRLERCNRHVGEHVPRYTTLATHGPEIFMAQTTEAKEARKEISDFLTECGSECLDRGVEVDIRYKSAIVYQDGCGEPAWDLKRYEPSTRPGSRAPHVFLRDGKTSILDMYGPEWSLIVFDDGTDGSKIYVEDAEIFSGIAKQMGVPVTKVVLKNEQHVHDIWGCDVALVCADGHVAWRGQIPPDAETARDVLMVVTGQKQFPGYIAAEWKTADILGLGEAQGKLSVEDFLGVGDQA